MTELDPVAIMTGAIGDLTTTFGGVAPAAIGLGIAVFGLGYAFNLVRRFV